MPTPPIQDVSDTAFWIAHHRALETARADALFRDPFAGRLAGERGRKISDAMKTSRFVAWTVAIRTPIIDGYLRAAIDRGVDTVLNLGAGLDARPYRMGLPAQLGWIEADYPGVIEYKEAQLAGERPRCRLERVRIDLADPLERRKLLARANAQAQRMLVLTEGLVPYLTVEEAAALADDLHALDRVTAWVVDYLSPRVMKYRRAKGMEREMGNAPFKFAPPDPFAFYAEHGWRVREIQYLAEVGERIGRPALYPLPMKIVMAISSLVLPKERASVFKRMAGYMVLEPRQ